jgi:hypothetical protein
MALTLAVIASVEEGAMEAARAEIRSKQVWVISRAHYLGRLTIWGLHHREDIDPDTDTRTPRFVTLRPMHYDAHQPVINDLEARILTIRDSL